MERNLKEALKHRRSYYAIDNQTTIPDAEIEEILDFAALYTPSAFNSQSTRMVLLLREQHRRLWDIVRNTLKKTIPAAAYASTEAKINKSFAAGYGTVLFFEDTAIIEGLQKAFPLYHEKFPQWSHAEIQVEKRHTRIISKGGNSQKIIAFARSINSSTFIYIIRLFLISSETNN